MPRAIPAGRFQALLDAARAVFLEQGYRRTQIADVAARMGVAKGSVYTYVESKEALFDCVLRHADRPDPVGLPEVLPVKTPAPKATLELLERRLAEEGSLPRLEAALARSRVVDAAAELEGVLGELYDTLASHRASIKLVDRCAADYPELAKVWYRAGRLGALSLLGRYLDDRARRGKLRDFDDPPVAARIVLETLVFWAVHRFWDPAPESFDEASARRTVLAFLGAALVDERLWRRGSRARARARRDTDAVADAGETFYQLARGTALVAALLLALGLERWRPHQRLRPAWGTNLGLWAVDAGVTAVVCGACGWVVAAWAADQGLGLLAWLGAGPWAALGVSLLALDAVSYLWHRANHRVPLLWRFHQVHHADESFHVTTGLRFHPGELLLAIPVRLAAILALGAPPEAVLLFELVFGVANLVEHGNFDLPAPLEPVAQRVFITPALHRAHHAADWRDLDTNFGTVFSIWDRAAGTLRASAGARRVATGLPDRADSRAPSLVESLWLPFVGRPRAH